MKRTFLKAGQFIETKACVLGTDFIGNGHWLLNRKYASNRKKFADCEQAKEFVKEGTEILEKHDTLEELIALKTEETPLSKCQISDVCLGKGVLVEIGGELRAIQAAYANLLKQISGKEDELTGNDQIIVARDIKGEVGLIISVYEMGDLMSSIRNREIVKLLSLKMNV